MWQDDGVVETAPVLPLVFFPGAAGKREYLQPIGQCLALRRPPIFCEYPGLGGTPPNPELRTLADLQRHLLRSLPERFDLVTMSMGGVLGLRVALEAPQRVRKLVLMATSGGVDVQAFGGVDWRDTFHRAQPNVPTWFFEERADLTPELARIPHPTLLIYGDADLIAPVAVGEHLCAHLPNARLEVIKGGTHDLEIDHPAFIASQIEAHLRRP